MQNPQIIENLLSKDECDMVLGMCIKTHNKRGKGFKKVVYKDAMKLNLIKRVFVWKRTKNLASNMRE